jgi:hypothetical protein
MKRALIRHNEVAVRLKAVRDAVQAIWPIEVEAGDSTNLPAVPSVASQRLHIEPSEGQRAAGTSPRPPAVHREPADPLSSE